MSEKVPEVVKTITNELQAIRLQIQKLMDRNQAMFNSLRLQNQELMNQHQVMLNKHYTTRFQTPEIFKSQFKKQDAADVPKYIPIEASDFITKLENYLFFEEVNGIKNCFTVVATHYAISFNHGSHESWKSTPGDNQTTVIIKNQKGEEFVTRVVKCNSKIDFVIVHSEVPLVSTPPIIRHPNKHERYVLLGYPNGSTNYQALEGIFPTEDLDNLGRLRGSSGSIKGYCGGPIFNYKGELIGVNVANEPLKKFIGFTGDSTVNEVVDELTMSFPCLSIIFPATTIEFACYECKSRLK